MEARAKRVRIVAYTPLIGISDRYRLEFEFKEAWFEQNECYGDGSIITGQVSSSVPNIATCCLD